MNEVRPFVSRITGLWSQGDGGKVLCRSGASTPVRCGCLLVPVPRSTGLRLYLDEDWNMLMVAMLHEVKMNALSKLQPRHQILAFHVLSRVMERSINCIFYFVL